MRLGQGPLPFVLTLATNSPALVCSRSTPCQLTTSPASHAVARDDNLTQTCFNARSAARMWAPFVVYRLPREPPAKCVVSGSALSCRERRLLLLAVKVVHVSDLSGKQVDESELGRLVVLEHPDFAQGPITLEVLPDEVVSLKGADQFVHLEYYPPGARRSEGLTVSLKQFNALAQGGAMNEIIRRAVAAQQERPGRSQVTTGRGGRLHPSRAKVNYATLEHAGEPHR